MDPKDEEIMFMHCRLRFLANQQGDERGIRNCEISPSSCSAMGEQKHPTWLASERCNRWPAELALYVFCQGCTFCSYFLCFEAFCLENMLLKLSYLSSFELFIPLGRVVPKLSRTRTRTTDPLLLGRTHSVIAVPVGVHCDTTDVPVKQF